MKAHGLDNLPAELFKSMPGALAKLYCPLYTKAALTCQQPAQWKGGILFDMYKGQGSADVASFRSLFISSLPAKAMHRILRSRLRGTMDDTLHELHCGSAKGRPVSLPTHVLRLALRKHKAAKQSCAVLFLDTATAYYAVVRDFALGDITSDKDILAIFCRFGLTDMDVCELKDLIQAGGVLTQSGVSEHLIHILKDIYTQTWFVSRFCQGDKICATKLGSRPGSTFADLIFAFIYHRILERIRCRAQQLGLHVPVPYSGAKSLWCRPEEARAIRVPLLDTTWADDSAFGTADADPERLLLKARKLATVVVLECRAHGLKPNLKRGKSALLLALRGTGCRKAAAAWFPNDKRTIDLPMPDGTVDVLHVESSYVHLGTCVDKDGLLDGAMLLSKRVALPCRICSWTCVPGPVFSLVQLVLSLSTWSCGPRKKKPGSLWRLASGGCSVDCWRVPSMANSCSSCRSTKCSI